MLLRVESREVSRSQSPNSPSLREEANAEGRSVAISFGGSARRLPAGAVMDPIGTVAEFAFEILANSAGSAVGRAIRRLWQ